MQGAFELLKGALNQEYKDLLPAGFTIYSIAEYDRWVHTAPHLLLEQKANLSNRYIAILTSDTESLSALGETVNDAVKNCIMKIEKRKNKGDA